MTGLEELERLSLKKKQKAHVCRHSKVLGGNKMKRDIEWQKKRLKDWIQWSKPKSVCLGGRPR